MNGLELVSTTNDAAFVTDDGGVIRGWNSAAEEHFDLAATKVIGRNCWDVLSGQDGFGNEYCSAHCPLRRLALKGQPVNRCQLFFRDAAGRLNAYSVAILVLRGTPHLDPAIVHLLHPAVWERRREGSAEPCVSGNHARGDLTNREGEVLRMLAGGESTRQIAEILRISPATVRNHIQHILFKLHAHSRLEAVAVARKAKLI